MEKIINFVSMTLIGILIFTIIPAVFFYYGLIKQFNFMYSGVDNLGLALTIIFGLIIFCSLLLYRQMKRIKTKQKYYDIMLTKFWDKNPSHPINVFEQDLALFDKYEKKYLSKILKEHEKLRIIMKGTNKVIGQFI